MSVEANTYEELHIQNVNEKTAEICGLVGEYLVASWNVRMLKLTVDGKLYETENSFADDSELHSVCKNLAAAKEIHLVFSSCGALSVGWRMDDSFMKCFTDNEEVKSNVTYRCTEYYDTDSGVAMYRYDKNGLQCMKYTDVADSVADIKEWYCYTPTLRIADEEHMENTKLHEQIMAIVTKLYGLWGLSEDDMDDRLDDDWEDYGEIIHNGSIRFSSENIPEIVALSNQLAELLQDSETAEFEFEIYAIPDGEGDYDFASVAIDVSGSAVKDTYCRF